MSAIRQRLKSITAMARRKQQRPFKKKLAMEECEARQLLAVFTVTSSLDTGAAGELRWAVNSANTNPGHDLINFNVSNVALTAGELAITDAVTIDGSTSLPVLIDISAANNSRIFRVDDSNPNTSLPVDMIQLQLRQGNTSSFVNGQGGAILNHESLVFERGVITENRSLVGGGIANHGDLVLTNTIVSEGTATGDGGGGLYAAPQSLNLLQNNSFLGNEAQNGAGGGILANTALVTITGDGLVDGNTAATRGGGMAIHAGAVADVSASNFSFNSAATGGGISVMGVGSSLDAGAAVSVESNNAGEGAGVAVSNRGSATLRGSVLSGNFANLHGGGIWASGFSTVNLRNAQVSSNQTGNFGLNGRGAGIYAQSNAQVDIENSIVSYNGALDIFTTVDRGGGIYAGSGVDLTVNNSTISGNVARNGGGVFSQSAANTSGMAVSITNSTVSGNFAYEAGAGIYSGRGTNLHLKCTTISDNNVFAGSGGGLHLKSMSNSQNVQAEIVNSQILNNSAYINGGGIASLAGVSMTITNSIVSGNSTTERGGGLYLSGVPSADMVINETQIDLSLISGNVASDEDGTVLPNGSGGGVWAGNSAQVEILTTTIESNVAAVNGGGVAMSQVGRFLMGESTVSGNISLNGGGASVVRSDATFRQTTFYGNEALSHGGGFYIESTLPNTVHLDHSTVSRNSAGFGGLGGTGGGLYAGNTAAVYALQVALDHTIVSNNYGFNFTGIDEIYDGGTPTGNQLVTASHSLIRDNSNTLFAPGNPDANGNKIGAPGLPIDAHLQPLGANGGPTLTMLPSNGSPAINAGDPLFSGPPVGDQRLLPYKRIAFGQIDMGSVEVQPPPPTPDFNNDGVADCSDINALQAVVVAGTNVSAFDLTGDGLVNNADVDKWLDDAPDVNGLAITRYLRGDINLDTNVDGADFLIWNANKFTTNSDWCAGDVNTDGNIDGGDFVVWNTNKFQSSPGPDGCGLFRDGEASRDAGDEWMFGPQGADAGDHSVVDHTLNEWDSGELNTTGRSSQIVRAVTVAPTHSTFAADLADEDEENPRTQKTTLVALS